MLNGDGLRVVLWVAGCSHCCKECQNPITWDPNGGLFFDEAAKNADVCILFYYWRNKLKFGAHFVTVQHKDGKFTGYNTFRTSSGPDDYGTSLETYIQKHKFFGTFLIAIKAKYPV